jgi:hypothetical protein
LSGEQVTLPLAVACWPLLSCTTKLTEKVPLVVYLWETRDEDPVRLLPPDQLRVTIRPSGSEDVEVNEHEEKVQDLVKEVEGASSTGGAVDVAESSLDSGPSTLEVLTAVTS